MGIVRARHGGSVLLVVAILAVTVAGASFAVPSEGELEEAREEARALATRAERAEDELAQVEVELEALQHQLVEKQGHLDVALAQHQEAEAAAMDASARARASEAELASAVTELEGNEGLVAGLARDAYKFGASATSPTLSTLELLGRESGDLADRLHYLTRGMDARSSALERSGALRTRVAALTERARDEERVHLAREAEAEQRRDEAAALHAQVAELVTEQSLQLDRSLQLVAEIDAAQEDVEVRIVALEEQVEREREEARRREAERRERERRAAERRAAQRAAAQVSVGAGPAPQLRSVGGITVDASLAPQLEALLNAARADGIVLGGHGYRSPEVTARLRRANGCPDVYRSPASSCRVPTARPGSSMHERGLAIDFTYRGRTICFPRPASRCSGNAAFDWLRANAGRYGLRNLPSEAWHWSTNGR